MNTFVSTGAPNYNPFMGPQGTDLGPQAAPGSAAGKNRNFAEMAELGGTLMHGSLAASVGLPKPGIFTQTSTTMEHLGSLGENQISADMSNFMALFQQLAQNMRGTARTQRTVDMQSQVSALQGAAAEMKSAAKSRFTASMIQSGMQIFGGLAQAGLSTGAAYKTLQGNSLTASGKAKMADARNGGEFRTSAQTESIRADGNILKTDGANAKTYGDALNGFSQAAGSLMNGAGGLVAAFYTLKADRHDAGRSELETQAKVFETGVQHSNDIMQQMMDVIRDVREKLQSMQQSGFETIRGISRNI